MLLFGAGDWVETDLGLWQVDQGWISNSTQGEALTWQVLPARSPSPYLKHVMCRFLLWGQELLRAITFDQLRCPAFAHEMLEAIDSLVALAGDATRKSCSLN